MTDRKPSAQVDASTQSGAANVALKCYANSGNPPVVNAVPELATTRLDIGCGAGDTARVLHLRAKVVDGVTLSETEAANAGQRCRRVVVADLETGFPRGLADETYDACIFSHVLKHLRWPGSLLQQIRSRLSRKGRGVPQLVVALPNIMCYKTRWPLIMGRFEYTEGGIMDASHFRWFTFQSGRRLSRKAASPSCSPLELDIFLWRPCDAFFRKRSVSRLIRLLSPSAEQFLRRR